MRRFFEDLKRRKVLPAALAYAAIGWLLLQAASIILPALLLPQWTLRLLVVLVLIGFPLAVTLAWFFDITTHGIQRTSELPEQKAGPSSEEPFLTPPPVDGAVASVSVLPFQNQSNAPDQDALADGLATEIHSTLGQMHQVRVASRRSAFSFRNSEEPVQKIAKALGVRYVLSGTVMYSGEQVRVFAELDDGLTGTQLWSKKYEGPVNDVLAIQSDIAEAIVSAFGIERERAEITGAYERPTDSLDAWNLVQKARRYILDFSETALDEAKTLLERAIKLDANYATAHAALGSVLIERVLSGFSEDLQADREAALQAVVRAQELAPRDSFVLKMSGMVLAICGQLDQSLQALRTCVKQAPFEFGAWGYFGWPLNARGTQADLEELQEIMSRLLRSAPDHPGTAYWLYHQSVACVLQGDLEAADKLMQQAGERHQPIPWAYMHIANIKGLLGKSGEAQQAAEQAAHINPKMTAHHYANCIERMVGDRNASGRWLDGLVAAGLLNEKTGA
jgi:adenylate cyclase